MTFKVDRLRLKPQMEPETQNSSFLFFRQKKNGEKWTNIVLTDKISLGHKSEYQRWKLFGSKFPLKPFKFETMVTCKCKLWTLLKENQ